MIIEARAPTRIDLAGGTLDIWPLNLLVPDPVTVNVAIDLYAVCRLTTGPGSRIRVTSHDRQISGSYSSLRRLDTRKGLELLLEFTRHFSPRSGFTLETACAAPAGSGLGGSSALAVALAKAFGRFCRMPLDRHQLLPLCRDLEAGVIRIPTGSQDYLAALHGGWNAIHYPPGGPRVERLRINPRALVDRLILCYTGRSRASARSNWEIFRNCVDGDPGSLNALRGIAAAASEMRQALIAGNWKATAAAMEREWGYRRRLSPTVGMGRVEPLLRAARRAGAAAGKPCGAGGGGCVLLICDPARRKRVVEAVIRAGGRIIDFRVAGRGVRINSLDGTPPPLV